MVACDACEKWFHFACVNVDATIKDQSWKCEGCATPLAAATVSTSEESAVTEEPLKAAEEFSTPRSHLPSSTAKNTVLLAKLESSLTQNIKLNKELAACVEREKQRELAFAERERKRDLDFEALRQKLEDLTQPSPEQNQKASAQVSKEVGAADGQKSSDDEEKEAAEFKRRYQAMLILEKEAAESNASNASAAGVIASLSQPISTGTAVDAITDLAITLKRPLMRKLPTFSGCPKEWPAFITLYDSTTKEGSFT
jgi:PHD-finger